MLILVPAVIFVLILLFVLISGRMVRNERHFISNLSAKDANRHGPTHASSLAHRYDE